MAESGVKLLFNNYIDNEILAYYAGSSEQASFPLLNAFNSQRRSKVWRSAGYFDVTSSNNTIVFRETALTDLTATITVAEYTSISSMCTAIKTALEAVGDSTYTVTNNASTGYKFQIVSNGSGGGGVFHLMVASGSFTAETLLGFSNAASFTDSSLTRLSDYTTINSSEWVVFDMGLVTNPKAFVLIGPRNEPLRISPSATITLQANNADAWTAPPFELELTYADNAIYHVNTDGIGDMPYRYWRLLIEDNDNPLGFIEVGAFFLGNYFNPSRGRVQFPLSVSTIDDSDTIISEGGQAYSDIKQPTASYNLSWFGLQKADIEEFEDQFQVYGSNRPFFVVMDSDATYSSANTRRVLFAKIQGTPQWNLISPDNFELSVSLVEVL
jgi:hypothetical protein